jgi:1-pyrroline-5-carboxylate dehydrogenase
MTSIGTTGFFQVPVATNEPVLSYAPGAPERAALQAELRRQLAQDGAAVELPLVVGGRDVTTGDLADVVVPHDHRHRLARAHLGGAAHVEQAIGAAMAARREWAALPWEERAAVFLRAAELLATTWRPVLNAATMLGQSKTAHQAEIDAACELIDFFRFNVSYLSDLMKLQPQSAPGTWNRSDLRPLDGFVLAVTPFNFTSIAGNLPTAPALMGNTVVWKPASTAMWSAHVILQLLRAAGLPDGVINLVYTRGSTLAKVALPHRDLAGVHFTGSTDTFNSIWQTVAANLGHYRAYPRLVGETGGKDFVIAHASADVPALATALLRGAFEYQGQKCSAASRAYVPDTLWPALRERLAADVATIRMGDPCDFRNFMGAVIDRASFDKLAGAIQDARTQDGYQLVAGGEVNGETGWFIGPTVVRSNDPKSRLMSEELFGPVLTIHVYEERRWEETLALVDETSPYALTGAVWARDRSAIVKATESLRWSAGNFYINDKPTGAVVGQQPFGGSRKSGTNDKAGSVLNLIRWMSQRSIKETFNPPPTYPYPYQT